MVNLKEQLQNDVINVIENPEEYKKHNLGLPNGMLLYGPPGCGKNTQCDFLKEKFNLVHFSAGDRQPEAEIRFPV